mgnify:CR=1 FL=1
MKVRAHVTIRGRVQGVYYRSSMKDEAQALGICGWVKNKPDGSVEGILEGRREDVEKLIEWCRQGPPMAEVSTVTTEWKDFTGKFSGFKIAF